MWIVEYLITICPVVQLCAKLVRTGGNSAPPLSRNFAVYCSRRKKNALGYWSKGVFLNVRGVTVHPFYLFLMR